MSFSVSHWSGRLGNNIQQVANCIMAAEKYKSGFKQQLDHDIISKFNVSFDGMEVTNWTGQGRYYSWQPLVHCEKGIYEGGNETGLDVDHIFFNMQRICRDYIAPNLTLPKKDSIGDDTIVMHLRSGDNCLLYTSPSPRDRTRSRMPSSA